MSLSFYPLLDHLQKFSVPDMRKMYSRFYIN